MPKRQASDLPHNSQAEKACIGSALISKDALFSVISELEEKDFYEGKNQIIFRCLVALAEKKIAVDVLTVTEELMNIKELENIGGVKYLQECSDSMVAISSLEFYIRIVKDQSVLRAMLLTIRDIDNKYKNEEIEDVNDFIQQSEIAFKDSTEKRRVSTFKSTKEITKAVELSWDTIVQSEGNNLIGLSSGFDEIDKYTQGFQKGEITIVAARPSVGKTALSLNFAYKIATEKGIPVAVFSLEMPSELLVKRLIAAGSHVSLTKINSGNLQGQDRAKVAQAIKTLAAAPIFIDDSANIRLMDIVAKSRQLQAKHPDLGLIVVDYLGLVTTGNSSRGNDSRQEEVRKISLALKGLAKDLRVPIVVVSQLSRDVEKRDSKKPLLSDLRDSGNIEQDADVVMLLYREDYYNRNKNSDPAGNKKISKLTEAEKFRIVKEEKEKELGNEMPGDASYVEVNIAKNRNGQTGVAGLFFFKSFGLFDSPTEEWQEKMRSIREENNID